MSDEKFDREEIKNLPKEDRQALNADPITGEPGSHPVGTGVGTAGGAVAGAAIGAVAGPIGAAVGGVVGAIVGAGAGHAVGEKLDPTVEEVYWSQHYRDTPYYQSQSAVTSDLDYDRDYKPAYRLGYESRNEYPQDRGFDDVGSDLSNRWEKVKGESRLKWEEAKHATRDAWDRLKSDR